MLDHAPKPKRDYSRALAALELLAVELRLTVAERVELERKLLGIESEQRVRLRA